MATSRTPEGLSAEDAASYFTAVIAAILSTAWGNLGPQTVDAAIARYKETLQKLRADDPFN
jgi:hypothetical protein